MLVSKHVLVSAYMLVLALCLVVMVIVISLEHCRVVIGLFKFKF